MNNIDDHSHDEECAENLLPGIPNLKAIIEGAIFAAGEPLTVDRLLRLFSEDDHVAAQDIRDALSQLQYDYQDRTVMLIEVGSGYTFQVKMDVAPWVQKLWEEKPPRYSRAVLETLALIAYRQPITRGEIEDIRGVAVSTHIMKNLLDREWVRAVGHRDVPGKPALYGTTKQFLDYFNLKNLAELPTLAELSNFENIENDIQIKLELLPTPVEEIQQEISTVEDTSEEKSVEEMSFE